MAKYEVWISEDPSVASVTMFPAEPAEAYAAHKKLLEEDAKLVRTIWAEDWEAAMTEHHRLMGWEPYKPFGVET